MIENREVTVTQVVSSSAGPYAGVTELPPLRGRLIKITSRTGFVNSSEMFPSIGIGMNQSSTLFDGGSKLTRHGCKPRPAQPFQFLLYDFAVSHREPMKHLFCNIQTHYVTIHLGFLFASFNLVGTL